MLEHGPQFGRLVFFLVALITLLACAGTGGAPPNFTVIPPPSTSLSVAAGGSVDSEWTWTGPSSIVRPAGWAVEVALQTPEGAAATGFTFGAADGNLNPVDYISLNTSTTEQMRLSVSGVAAGTYSLVVISTFRELGTGGSVITSTRTPITVTVTQGGGGGGGGGGVQRFTILANPSPVIFPQFDVQEPFTLTVSPIGNYQGTVTLSFSTPQGTDPNYSFRAADGESLTGTVGPGSFTVNCVANAPGSIGRVPNLQVTVTATDGTNTTTVVLPVNSIN